MKTRLSLLLVLTPIVLSGYVHQHVAWPSGDITVHLQLHLNAPVADFPLSDLSASWNAAANPGVTHWDSHLDRVELVTVMDSTAELGQANQINNVVWADDIYGEPFDERTLAVTVLYYADTSAGFTRFGEADILINRSHTWNAYRGNLRRAAVDLRRVMLHEVGHLLGLDHPDEAQPAQSVEAIMNSETSAVYQLQDDDRAGAAELYGTPLGPLAITRLPAGQTVPVGGRVELTWDLNGGPAPAPGVLQRYAWYFQPLGGIPEYLFTWDDPTLSFGAAQPEDTGTYRVVAEHPDATAVAEAVEVVVTPIATSSATRLANLATRGIAGTGDRSMIVGFVITGATPKRVLLRAIGPTLRSDFGVDRALSDPTLTLYQQDGGTTTVVASNGDWADLSTTARDEIETTGSRVGAFALTNSREAVLLLTLAPGTYSAVVGSARGDEGVALVEAYDADAPGEGGSRLGNLSTRGYVGSGADVLIGGFVVAGPAARTYLLRAVGDTLKDFGVNETLDDPMLVLYQDQNRVRLHDDWDSPGQHQPMLTDTMAAAGAFPFTDRQESVMKLTLPPGAYSLHVQGWGDGEGVALLELYELTAPDGRLEQ